MSDQASEGRRGDRRPARRVRPPRARPGHVPRGALRPRPGLGALRPRASAGSGCGPTSTATSSGACAKPAPRPPDPSTFFTLPRRADDPHWGTDEQKQRFLRPMYTGAERWCQLFSEPGAGSDFAGLATRRARRRRVDRQRAEGVEHARPPRRLGDARHPHRSRAAQAQGDDVLRGRHALAGRRGATAAPDHRARPSSTRCTSPTRASPTPTASARSARAGASR